MTQNVVLTMRPVRDDDEPFLRELLSQIDSERLSLNHLDSDSQQIIVNHQFEARNKHFNAVDMESNHCVILSDDTHVGRIIIMQNGQEIRIGDLSILPAYRRRGIATAIIQGVQGESVQSKRPVTIHVNKFYNNGALSLYLRLGFTIDKELETHFRMAWSAETNK